jgi:hypothetical protein
MGARLVLLGGFVALVAAFGIAVAEAQRSLRVSTALVFVPLFVTSGVRFNLHALVAARLLSVLLFPLAALTLVRGASAPLAAVEPEPLG